MQIPIEYIFIGISVLLILSVLGSKISEHIGVPSLLIFLIIGMLAGSEGLGGIAFDNALLAQSIGIAALISILFSGGLDTDWKTIKPIAKQGIALSTIAVVLTAFLVASFSYYVTHFTFNESMLLGAIVSSTDAAAVFSILRSKGVHLKRELQAVIELESASNDPTAVLLTLGLIQIILVPSTTITHLFLMFVAQVTIGVLIGWAMGHHIPRLINMLKLEYKGLYPVLTIALVCFTYGITTVLHGNGFLAVYLTGLTMSGYQFTNKENLIQFHDGLTWLMQIIMFITLGLLVFPSKLLGYISLDILLAFFLILIARPISVFITLFYSKLQYKELLMISWVGLRGAVPIILATFPLVAGIPKADIIFNHVFFIVLTSILVQGTLVPFAARVLSVEK
ncbi:MULTISPECIES: potassium/proton antiporter [unclassified Legionella]|uniref:potassium/proton antiporter n=1 Tax=unclassified Legionella TaxID=2622702 RepID=UPI001055A7DF|nr:MULTISPECIES: potassium/proton antiporter [unclassified Legionella]MDI9819752.1 potassium/proton antiporter [Legionella sp. PL877]